jgi:hypothetical protein
MDQGGANRFPLRPSPKHTGGSWKKGNKAAAKILNAALPLPPDGQPALIRCANFWRNFATFGATTNEQ